MTVNLSIKNVPEDTVALLRARAKQNHRSLQGELLALIEAHVAPRRLTIDEAYQRIRATGLRTGAEAVTMVRGDRNAR